MLRLDWSMSHAFFLSFLQLVCHCTYIYIYICIHRIFMTTLLSQQSNECPSWSVLGHSDFTWFYREKMASSRVYVGNIDWKVTSEDLKDNVRVIEGQTKHLQNAITPVPTLATISWCRTILTVFCFFHTSQNGIGIMHPVRSTWNLLEMWCGYGTPAKRVWFLCRTLLLDAISAQLGQLV